MNHVLACLVAVTCLAACHTSPSAGRDIPFRSIARGYQTGLAGEGVQVARDEAQWRALWNRHASTVIPRPLLPSVDFDSEMVVCVLLGTRPTFGYAIEVTRIVPDGERGMRIEVSERAPAEGAITSPLVTQPFHMIATPRRTGTCELVVR